MYPGGEEVTRLLKAMRAGEAEAAEQLLPLIYQELHRLARSYMRRERPEHTLQPTALIHEAYLRLAQEEVDWTSRQHFIGIAAHTMRRVLVDYARAHRAERRGGGMQRVEFIDSLAISANRLDEVMAIDEALGRLSQLHARQAQVVELRYFGGLSVEETAEILGVAPRSVKRDWSLAKLWLFRELRPGAEPTADQGK